MKRTLSLLIAVLTLLSFIALSGCTKHEEEKTLFADDPEVLAKWDEYSVLSGIPRFTFNGVFDNIYSDEERVVVSYLGVTESDYIEYTKLLQLNGFRLKENSAIWITEGLSGVPEFVRMNEKITLVWSINGGLDISAEYPGQSS